MVLDHDFDALAGKSKEACGVYQLMKAHKNEVPRRVVVSSCKVQSLKSSVGTCSEKTTDEFYYYLTFISAGLAN